MSQPVDETTEILALFLMAAIMWVIATLIQAFCP